MGRTGRDQRIRRTISRRAWAVGVVMAGGLLAAACSSSPSASSSSTTTGSAPDSSSTTGGSTAGRSGLASIVTGIKRSTGATFSATYSTANSTTGKSQTITFAQSPPKSAVVTSSGSYYIDGSAVTVCQGSGASATCQSLPSNLGPSVSAITNLFSPGVLTTTLQGIEVQTAAHAAGFSVHTSTATYGGVASNCATLKSPSQPGPVTYCVAKSSGILTYSSTNGTTVTLTAFTANPPASTFSVPSGATVQTLPAGT